MGMSKKHFIELADQIRMYNRTATEPATEAQIEALACFCASQNPNFKRQRWLDYVAGTVGPNGGAVKR